MRPYSDYRETEIPSLGSVPDHWDLPRLGFMVECLDGRRIPLNSEERAELQGDIPYWGANGVLDRLQNWLFDEPLVLLGEDGAPFFAPNKTVAFAVSGQIWVNNHAHVLRPRGIDHSFLTHLLNVTDYSAYVDGSTRDKLTQNKMNSIPVPLPPMEEQREIAAFLDRETERIDSLIAKKRLLIERLQEYRTALITRTVTRGLPPQAARAAGLDPSPRLKPSGVEWLGDVPEHWSTRQLRRIANLNAGYGITSDEIESEGYFPVFGGNGIRGFTDTYTHEGEFVLIGRQGALCGNVHMARDKFWASEHAVVAEASRDVNVPWLRFVLDAMNLRQYSAAAAQPGLAVDKINGLSVSVPPETEQHAISEFLGRANARIDELASRVDDAIERLQEYRTAIITAAVTGKIDVRETASSDRDAVELQP